MITQSSAMKKIALLIIFFTSSKTFFAQNSSVVISGRTQQVAYIGLDNPIEVKTEGLGCESLSVSLDNGSLHNLSPCRYWYRPSKPGEVRFRLYKAGNDSSQTVEQVIRVEELPDPIAVVGGKKTGNYLREALRAQAGVAAVVSPSIGIDLRYAVVEYTVVIIREDKVIFFEKAMGNAFNQKIKTGLDLLEKGDIIIFGQIRAVKADGKVVHIAPLEFFIQ